MANRTFEECYEEIHDTVYKRRNKWKYQLNSFDFDDVAQIIIHHIYTKWDLYDQTMPLLNYVNRVTTNQMINLARNHYNTYLPPCQTCYCRTNETDCSLFGTQDKNQCGVLKKWHTANKQDSYNINLPVSTEHHSAELKNRSNIEIDYEKVFAVLQDKSKKILTNLEYTVFDLVFIQQISEVEVLQKLGYKSNKNSKGQYSKQLEHIKDNIYKKIKKYIYSENCDISL